MFDLSLFQNLPLSTWVLDIQGRWTCNQCLRDFVGMASFQFPPSRYELIHPDDRRRVEDDFHLAQSFKQAFEISFRVRGANGYWRSILEKVQPCFDLGEYVGLVGVWIDQTEQKEAMEALIFARQNHVRAKIQNKQVVEYLNQAISNSANIISQSNNLLIQGFNECNSEQALALNQIKLYSSYLKHIHKNLLPILGVETSGESATAEFQDLKSILVDLLAELSPLAAMRDNVIQDETTAFTTTILSTYQFPIKSLLWEIFFHSINLVQAGIFRLAVRPQIENQCVDLEIHCWQDAKVKTSFMDWRFFENSLPILNFLTLENGISIDFQELNFSSFRYIIHIPNHLSIPKATQNHIVIVDDDTIILEVISGMLQGQSMDVHYFSDGRSALNYCLEHSDIRVALLDLNLPNFNGYELARMINKLNPEIKLIAFSGSDFAMEMTEYLKSPFVDYIEKPIVKSTLVNAIEQQIQR